MTVINRIYDPGLGRYRDHYPHEMPPDMRGTERAVAAGQRRQARDAKTRARRAERQTGRQR